MCIRDRTTSSLTWKHISDFIACAQLRIYRDERGNVILEVNLMNSIKIIGIISIVIAAIILLVGIISPVSIILCSVVTFLLAILGIIAIRKGK